MKVVTSIPYEWWTRTSPWYDREQGKLVLPDALGEERNTVMNLEEMKAYDAMLKAMLDDVDHERERVRITLLAIERKHLSSWMYSVQPTIFSLAHALEFMVKMAKHKLAGMNLMLAFTARAVEMRKMYSGDAHTRPPEIAHEDRSEHP